MSEKEVLTLSYAVRGRVVLKYFGQLCNILAVLIFAIVIVSVIFREYLFTFHYLIVLFFILASGIILSRLKASSDIQPNEALVITSLIFLFASFILSYPMVASGMSFDDALFESVSGITTTGLTTLSAVQGRSETFLFARAWMQWFGGLGIVVLSVAILIRPGVTTKRLIDIEKAEDIIGGTRFYAQRVLKIYTILTCLAILILVLLGIDLFTALLHTLAAVSTGGFSSFDNSLAGLNSRVAETVVMIISLSGALSLIFYFRIFRKGWRGVVTDNEVNALILCSLIATVLLVIFMGLKGKLPMTDILKNAPLLALSAQTTTGFTTLDMTELDSASKLVLIVSMILGGNIGSTAGGIKMLRLIIFLKMLKLTFIHTTLPSHAVIEPRISGHKIEDEEISRALLLIILFLVIILLSWLPFVAMGYDPLNALFDVVSAAGTVGLSTGVTGPYLPPVLKGILCADMLMGRLEIIGLLILLYPRTWVGRRNKTL